jgi:hypothetical protein
MRACFGLVLLLGLFAGGVSAETTPCAGKQDLCIELRDRLTIPLYLAPDHGTRFVFPFILDSASDDVSYGLHIISKTFTTSKDVSGRDYFLMQYNFELPTDKEQADQIRDAVRTGTYSVPSTTAYLTVAGYHVTFEVHATFKPEKVYNNIYFSLNPEKREELITAQVAKRAAVLEQEYHRKQKELDARAQALALNMVGQLILDGKTSTDGIFEEGTLSLPSGNEITVEVVDVIHTGGFHVLSLLLNYKGISDTPLLINDVRLVGKTGEDATLQQSIPVAHMTTPTMHVGERQKSAVTTNDVRFTEYEDYTLIVSTNLGEVSVTW